MGADKGHRAAGGDGIRGTDQIQREGGNLPKAHWIDAACVGKSTPADVVVKCVSPLEIKATVHNSRQMCRVDNYGFPRTSAKGQRMVKGFRTGDLIKAEVRSGKKIGSYVGRFAVRSSVSFNVMTAAGMIEGISLFSNPSAFIFTEKLIGRLTPTTSLFHVTFDSTFREEIRRNY